MAVVVAVLVVLVAGAGVFVTRYALMKVVIETYRDAWRDLRRKRR